MLIVIYKRKTKPKIPIICQNCGKVRYVVNSLANTAKFCSKECVNKINCFKKGFVPWNKNIKIDMSKYKDYGMTGKKHKKSSNEKNRIKHLGKKVWNDGLMGYKIKTKYKVRNDKGKKRGKNKNISIALIKKYQDPIFKQKQLLACRRLTRIQKISKSSLEHWQDPDFVKKQIKAHHVKQNKVEKNLENILNKILPNEYKFVGDGEFILGGKCPDFLNINGKKKLIELYGEYWHGEEKTGITKENAENERINHFKQFGFNTLIIWENELKEQSILQTKLINFTTKI